MPSAQTDPKVLSSSPILPKYSFLASGDTYLTKACRSLTYEKKSTCYVVLDPKTRRPVGIRVPSFVLAIARQRARATAAERASALQKRDHSVAVKVSAEILRQLPLVPKQKVPIITHHMLKKHSGRVGRTAKLELEDKVRLAVWAHVRHNETSYDSICKRSGREVAREEVKGDIEKKIEEWGGTRNNKNDKMRRLPPTARGAAAVKARARMVKKSGAAKSGIIRKHKSSSTRRRESLRGGATSILSSQGGETTNATN